MSDKQISNSGNEAELKLPWWKAYFWYLILWLMMLVDIMDRQVVAAILPMLKSEFLLTDAQAGVVSSIIGITIALLVVPTAMLADRWSRRKVVALMVGIWSVATYATGMARGYISLVAARLSVGVGEAGYLPVAYSLISAWFPKTRRGLMIGLFHASVPIGSAVGIMVGGWLAYKYGWRTCFGILAVPGLILAVLAWFMPDFKNKKVEVKKETSKNDTQSGVEVLKPTIKGALSYIFTSPAVLSLYFVAGSIQIATNSLGIWGPTLFARSYDMNVKDAAMAVGYATLIGMIGAPIIGFIADKAMKYMSKGRLLIVVVSALSLLGMVTIASQTAMTGINYKIFFISWAVISFFVMGAPASIGTMTQDLVPPFYRAIAAGFLPVANQLIGGVWGPIITGALSDRFGIAYALQVVVLLSVCLVVILAILTNIFYKRALDRINKMGHFNLEADRGKV